MVPAQICYLNARFCGCHKEISSVWPLPAAYIVAAVYHEAGDSIEGLVPDHGKNSCLRKSTSATGNMTSTFCL